MILLNNMSTEKRLLIAIVLSFIVLNVWVSMFAPKRSADLPNNTQILDNKELTPNLGATPSPSTSMPSGLIDGATGINNIQNAAVKLANNNAEESVETIVTERYTLQVSNLGGNLKSITINEFEHTMPVTNILNIEGFEKVTFNRVETYDNRISFETDINGFNILKTYEIRDGERVIFGSVTITNKTEMSKLADIRLDNIVIKHAAVGEKKEMSLSRAGMLTEYSYMSNGEVERKRNASKFKKKEDMDEEANIDWIGFRDQYFCIIAKPQYEALRHYVSYVSESEMRLGTYLPSVMLQPEESFTFSTLVYVGPQDMKLLKEFELGFEDIINYKMGGFIDMMSFNLTDVIANRFW